MLLTIEHGKGGRIRLPDSDTSVSWRELFKQYEDLLTGAFFGRLRYLSRPVFAMVMERLVGPLHASKLGELTGFEFWPNLHGLEGRSRVQPDVLITFEQATILIEVKSPSGHPQSVAQWSEQLNAFLAEIQAGKRAASIVHFVALGRLDPVADVVSADQLGDAGKRLDWLIHRHEWDGIVAAVPEWLTRVRQGQLDASPADVLVLEDIQVALDLFGIRRRVLLPWIPLSEWAAKHALQVADSKLWARLAQPLEQGTSDRLVDWSALASYAVRNPLRSS